MTGGDLRSLREELHFSQTEMARALNVSYATLNRWETGAGGREIPTETCRLLECLREVVQNSKGSRSKITTNELREAIAVTGVAGAIAAAAQAGLITTGALALLALTAPFSWIAGVVGVGATVALPFFMKLRNRHQTPNTEPAEPMAEKSSKPKSAKPRTRKCKGDTDE